tara:strand:+ start:6434 stop:8002 length:1569 start_codon:yes stop_codon:yes gene_type:complete
MIWKNTSPSQIKTYRSCKRKWFFSSVKKLPRKQSKAAALGNTVHEILEDYNRHRFVEKDGLYVQYKNKLDPYGKDFDWGTDRAGLIAKSGSTWIWDITTPFKIECWTNIKNSPIPIKGRIDLLENKRVTDYKTTSDFKWIPSEEELRRDPQCIIYCQDAFDQFTDLNTIDYRHIYMQTRVISSRVMSFSVSRSETNDRFNKLFPIITDQLNYSTCTDQSDIPYNLGACKDFGGCPYSTICTAKKDNIMGFMDRLKTTKNKSEDQEEYLSVADKARIQLIDAGVITQRQADNMSVAQLITLVSEQAQDEIDLINPPDGKPASYVAPPPKASKPKKSKNWKEATSTECFKKAATILDVSWKDLKVAVKEDGWSKEKLRTATIELMSGDRTTFLTLFEDPKQKPITEPTVPKAPQVTKKAKEEHYGSVTLIPTLYINCIPNERYVDFTSFILPYVNIVEQESGSYFGALDYGRGPQLVAMELAKELKTLELPYNLVIDSNHPCSKTCAEILQRKYKRVIKGFVTG